MELMCIRCRWMVESMPPFAFLSHTHHHTLTPSHPHRLEGEVPSAAAIQEQKTVGGVPGFDTPKLPRPGEEVIRKNALRIEKLATSIGFLSKPENFNPPSPVLPLPRPPQGSLAV